MTSVPPPTQQYPNLPSRPKRRPKPRRAQNLLFWAVLLLFIAAVVYISQLASSDNLYLIRRAEIDLHRNAEIPVAICAIAVVVGAIVPRYHVRCTAPSA